MRFVLPIFFILMWVGLYLEYHSWLSMFFIGFFSFWLGQIIMEYSEDRRML